MLRALSTSDGGKMGAISLGKGQCFREASKVSRAVPSTLPRLHSSTDLSHRI